MTDTPQVPGTKGAQVPGTKAGQVPATRGAQVPATKSASDEAPATAPKVTRPEPRNVRPVVPEVLDRVRHSRPYVGQRIAVRLPDGRDVEISGPAQIALATVGGADGRLNAGRNVLDRTPYTDYEIVELR